MQRIVHSGEFICGYEVSYNYTIFTIVFTVIKIVAGSYSIHIWKQCNGLRRSLDTSSLLLLSSSAGASKQDESSSVRLRVDAIPKGAKQFFTTTPFDKSPEFVIVLSCDVQKMMKITDCSINLIEDDFQPPLIQLRLKDDISQSNKNLQNYGVKLPENVQSKVIGIHSNIDETMLNVRLKQIGNFLQTNHTVIIVVKIVGFKKLMVTTNMQSVLANEVGSIDHLNNNNNERQQMKNLREMEYDKNLEKYTNVFADMPCKVLSVDRPDRSKVVIVLEPVK
ncbi:unnamed protein product [Heterobilharzia americana]|nr:unnamed protein product [Heterobilharzia americana]